MTGYIQIGGWMRYVWMAEMFVFDSSYCEIMLKLNNKNTFAIQCNHFQQ